MLGFLNMLLRANDVVKPDYLVVAFDRPEATFRHDRYDLYKAHREKAPEEFRSQVPLIKELLSRLNVPILEQSGFEADDIMGSLAHIVETTTADLHTILFTGDKDALQLITDRTTVMLPQKGSELLMVDCEKTISMTGLHPSQVVDFKALKGDASDNIPGVPGIGDKTATQLILQFGSLDNLYDNINDISSEKLKRSLIEHKDLAYLSRDLAKIHIELPLALPLSPIKIHLADARSFFETYELHGYLKKTGGPSTKDFDPVHHPTNSPWRPSTLIENQDKWTTWLSAQSPTASLAFVPIIHEGDWVGFAAASSDLSSVFVPLSTSSGETDHSSLGPMFKSEPNNTAFRGEWLSHYSAPFIVHDYKALLANIPPGVSPPPLKHIFDIMLMDYLVAPDRLQHGIARLLKEYFREELPPLKEWLKANMVESVDQLSAEKQAAWAGTLACSLFRLYQVIAPDLRSKDLLSVYEHLDLPLIPVLHKMEARGIRIDVDYLKRLSVEYHAEARRLEAVICEMAGSTFNVNSPKQLSQILFGDLKLPVQNKTKTGASTDSDALEALIPHHPIAQKILEYRQLTKLLNTYIDVLPTMMDKDHRVHTTFNITVAATGRLSSSDPNIQNIPIRTELGERIRRAFIASPGWSLIAADYSQIELRILAHMSGDENLIAAFIAGHDIHTATASTIFKIPYDDITPSVRRRAKEINFGIAYGMKAFGLASRLGIPQKEASSFIDAYFSSYPKIRTILDETIQHVRDHGWVGTLFGRKRFFPGYAIAAKKDQQAFDRMIINTPFQGSAADIIKMAMLAVEKSLSGLEAKMILQIHDELIIDCPPHEIEQVKEILKKEMESVCSLVVPLTVNIGIGPNWLEAK